MARTYFSAKNDSVQSTTSTTYSTVVSLTFAAVAGKSYALFYSSRLWNSTNATADARMQFRNAATAVTTVLSESRATTEQPMFGGVYAYTAASSGSVTFDIRYSAETSGNSISVSYANIIALELDDEESFVHVASRVTGTASGGTTVATLNVTPAIAGEYLIISSSMINDYSTTLPVSTWLTDGTNNSTIDYVGASDTANRIPGLSLWMRTLNAGTPIPFAYRIAPAANGNTVGATTTTIVALRLDRFSSYQYQELASNFTMASTTATTITTLTPADATDHLFIGGWYTLSTTTNQNIETAIVSNAGAATTRAVSLRRSYGTGGWNSSQAFAIANNVTTWTPTVRNSTSANNATVSAGSAFTILSLEGEVDNRALLNVTEANETSSSTGKLIVGGSLSATELNDTVVSSTKLAISALSNVNEANDTLSSNSVLIAGPKATFNSTDQNETVSSTANPVITATVQVTHDHDILLSDTDLIDGPIGTVEITEDNDQVQASSTVKISATSVIVESDETSASNSSLKLVGSSNISEQNDGVVTQSKILITSGVQAVDNDDLTDIQSKIKLSASLINDDDNDFVESTTQLDIGSNSVFFELDDSSESAGSLEITSSLHYNEFDDSVSSVVTIVNNAQLISIEFDDLVDSTSTLNLGGLLDYSEENDFLYSTISTSINGQFAIIEQDDLSIATANSVFPNLIVLDSPLVFKAKSSIDSPSISTITLQKQIGKDQLISIPLIKIQAPRPQ